MLYICLAVLVWAPIQLVIHEGSHALVMKLVGGRIVEFKPWPHRRTHSDGVTRWWFGYTMAVLPSPEPSGYRWSHIAPMLAALTVATCALALAPIVWQPLLGVAVAATIDCLNWWRGYFWGDEMIDGRKWRER